MKIFGCKILTTDKDGGPESTVWAHWLIECKRLFSIVLLRFEDGSRDAYHEHAFDCVSWVLRGRLVETLLDGDVLVHCPSWRPIITRRSTFHKVRSSGRTWVLSFRGPWARFWREYIPGTQEIRTLTHGRAVVSSAGLIQE